MHASEIVEIVLPCRMVLDEKTKLVFSMCYVMCCPFLAVVAFTDPNIVVNVTAPVTMRSIPLKSVSGWLVILSRIDGNFPYNATWSTYKNDFGRSSSNFWIGLESLYQLTSELFQTTCGQFYRLRFEMQSATSGRLQKIYDCST